MELDTKSVMVLVTCSSTEEATKISRALLEEKLVACCNVLPGVTSLYKWKGNIEEATEALLVCKTAPAKAEKAAKMINDLHSYEVPVIETLPTGYFGPAANKWLEDALEEDE